VGAAAPCEPTVFSAKDIDGPRPCEVSNLECGLTAIVRASNHPDWKALARMFSPSGRCGDRPRQPPWPQRGVNGLTNERDPSSTPGASCGIRTPADVVNADAHVSSVSCGNSHGAGHGWSQRDDRNPRSGASPTARSHRPILRTE